MVAVKSPPPRPARAVFPPAQAVTRRRYKYLHALLLDQPNFRDLAVAAIAAEAQFAEPTQIQFSTRRRLLRYGKLDGLERNGSGEVRMNLDRLVRDEAHLPGIVSAVNHAEFVARLG